MKKNIGRNDRILRLVLALILFALAWNLSGVVGVILVLAGLFCLFQALVGWCALYALLGKNSCPLPGAKESRK